MQEYGRHDVCIDKVNIQCKKLFFTVSRTSAFFVINSF